MNLFDIITNLILAIGLYIAKSIGDGDNCLFAFSKFAFPICSILMIVYTEYIVALHNLKFLSS